MHKTIQLRVTPDLAADPARLRLHVAREEAIDARTITALVVRRRSVDARQRTVYVNLGLDLYVNEEPPQPDFSDLRYGDVSSRPRVVVVGAGPGGLFAALRLIELGLRPVVLERGPCMEERQRAVETFRAGGGFDPEANVQFGEGGAGAFSDGKLGTGTHDRRISFVLDTLIEHGAKPSIAYDAKPHLGTDVLSRVVVSIRKEIERLGGRLMFRTRLEGLDIQNGSLRGVTTASGGETAYIRTGQLILATGHSARDTFKMLLDAGLPLEPKAFSMGARIEHLQRDIDLAQYGMPRGKKLPAADYGLNIHLPGGRGVYTFCMCPGGVVINAASEPGGVVTNGMSWSGRAGENANSALLVSVTPADFPYPGPLGGALWQREIERRAFEYIINRGFGIKDIDSLNIHQPYRSDINLRPVKPFNPCKSHSGGR